MEGDGHVESIMALVQQETAAAAATPGMTAPGGLHTAASDHRPEGEVSTILASMQV